MQNEESKPLTKKERRELAKQQRLNDRQKSETFSKIKKYGIWLIVLVVVSFLSYKTYKYLFTSVDNTPVFSITSKDHIKGPNEAKATIIEYSDFQCPACKTIAPLIDRLATEFPNDLKIVFRDFPLITIHDNALMAAKAAEAAGEQGKYWEMHNVLFEKQEQWGPLKDVDGIFNQYAADLGLDQEKFMADLKSKEIEEMVRVDIETGGKLRINSTPTIYLNGKKIVVESYEQLKREVEKAVSVNTQ